jgi:hypothetical protein
MVLKMAQCGAGGGSKKKSSMRIPVCLREGSSMADYFPVASPPQNFVLQFESAVSSKEHGLKSWPFENWGFRN